jgi:hypothetical protein
LSSTVTASARSFASASSESLSIANANLGSLNPQDTDFTLSVWVYSTSLSGVKSFSGAWGANGNFLLYSNGTTLSWSVQNPSGTNATVSMASASTATWYHMVGTHSAGSDVIELYVDGVSKGTAGLTGGARSVAGSFFFGSDDLGRYMDGRLQQGGFWTRVLTSAQVTELYNSGVPKQFRELSANLNDAYAFWDMVETSGIGYNATATATKNLTDNNTVTSAVGVMTYTAEDASQFTAANSEYLSISNAAQTGLNPGNNTSFYVCGWYRPDSFPSAYPIIFGKGDGSTGYHLFLENATGEIKFINRAQAKTAVGGLFVASNWAFFEAYYDATNDLLGVSLNRATDSTVADTVGMSTSTLPVYISTFAAAGNYLNGRASDFVFISGVPTASERNALFGRGFGVDVSDRPALSAASYTSWWKMNEASGNRADSIGTNTLVDNNTVTGNPGVVYDAVTPPPAGGNYGSTLGFSGIIQ